MRVFVTNDDGINAPGIRACLDSLVGNEVFVVAPMDERSAISGALTLRSPVSYREMYLEGVTTAYCCDGTPVDCAKLAFATLLASKPDIMISGFNRGLNVGQDVFYSGTVAAALEGAYCNVPTLAVSLQIPIQQSANVAKSILPALMQIALEWPESKRGYLLSVNVPAKSNPPVVITRHGNAAFDYWHERNGLEQDSVFLRGNPNNKDPMPDSDAAAIQFGCVSVCPIRLSLSDNLYDARPAIASLASLVSKYFGVLR